MKTVLVIGRTIDDENSSFGSAERLVDALKNIASYQVEFATFTDFSFHLYGQNYSIINERTGKDLSEYDLVFLRDWFVGGWNDLVLSLSVYMDAKGTKYLNQEAAQGRASSKLSQHVIACVNQAAMPATFSGNRQALVNFIESQNFFGYPCIVKVANAARGQDNFLVHDRQELLQAYDAMEGRQTLIQEFIPNDGDYRVLMHDDKVLMTIQRKRSTDSASHLNNTSQGGTAIVVPNDTIPAEVMQRFALVSKRLGRTFTGLDIIEHRDRPGTYLCLEINNMPQMETGALVDEKLSVFSKLLEELVN